MAEWVIERLDASHERAEFHCGHPTLDSYLRTLVSQFERRRLGRTFVAVEAGASRVAGYYTLAAGSFDASNLPAAERKKLPRHPIPTIHLGRLAMDKAFQGQRLGETLLFHALRSALEVSEQVGAFAVDVMAIDDGAAAFYRNYGFIPFQDNPRHLHLPMRSVERLLTG